MTVPASWLAAALFLAGAIALIWTAWAPHMAWLVVAVGLWLAGGFVAYQLDRFEERRAQRVARR